MFASLQALQCVGIVGNFNTSYSNVSHKMCSALSLACEVPRYKSPMVADIKVKTKQDRQCTYNVTLRRVPATTVVVEEQ